MRGASYHVKVSRMVQISLVMVSFSNLLIRSLPKDAQLKFDIFGGKFSVPWFIKLLSDRTHFAHVSVDLFCTYRINNGFTELKRLLIKICLERVEMWCMHSRFYGPDLLCRLVKFGQVMPIYLSSFILTLMAVDRVGVTKRHGSMEPKPLRPLIQGVWVVAILCALPQPFIFSIKDIDDQGIYDCWADFGGEKWLEKVGTFFRSNSIHV